LIAARQKLQRGNAHGETERGRGDGIGDVAIGQGTWRLDRGRGDWTGGVAMGWDRGRADRGVVEESLEALLVLPELGQRRLACRRAARRYAKSASPARVPRLPP
jgi:hypothetical protein